MENNEFLYSRDRLEFDLISDAEGAYFQLFSGE